MLAKAEPVDDVKDIRDKAEALRVYAKQAGYGLDIQNRVAELKIRAERKAGELIPKTITVGRKSHDVTLSDLGIEPMQSHRWQFEYRLPEAEFERYIAETKERGTELIRGVIMVRRQDAPRVEAFLKEYGAKYHVRTIELEPSDQKKLGLT